METKHSFFGSRIAVALTAFALAAGIPALAQQSTTTPSDSTQSAQTAPKTKAEKKAARKERKEKMAQELGLTDQQKQQMKALQQDQRKQMKAVRDDSSLSQEQKQAKVKEIHKAGMEKRDALLTPEQREKIQHLRAENEAEEGHRNHHKKHQTTPSATTETPKS